MGCRDVGMLGYLQGAARMYYLVVLCLRLAKITAPAGYSYLECYLAGLFVLVLVDAEQSFSWGVRWCCYDETGWLIGLGLPGKPVLQPRGQRIVIAIAPGQRQIMDVRLASFKYRRARCK